MKNRNTMMHRSDHRASVDIQMSRISPRFKRKIFTSLVILTFTGQIQAQSVPPPTWCTQSGYYYDSALKQCQICPAGYACETTSSKVQCTTGTYSLSGQTTCKSCPTGFICPNLDQTPQVCLQGTYPSADQLTCIDCPAGKICPNPQNTSPVTSCQTPQFYQPNTNQVECTPCPAGKICSTITGAPTSCATGFTSSFGTGQCSTSSAGSFVPSQTMAVESCPSGLYQNQAGQSTCKYCDAGSSCSSTSAAPVSCPTGTFSAEGATACSSCATGYLCSDKTQASQTPCIYGQYLDTTVTPNVCKTCPNGYQCSENAILTQTLITAQGTTCPVGYTQTGKNCLHVGFRNTVSLATTGLTTITACGAGQYVPFPGGACTNCPTNSVCNLTPCQPGATQNPELCTPCPSGLGNCSQATIQLPTPRQCPAGYYSSSNSKCSICPEGSYCPLNSQPVGCPTYTYSGKGMTACLQCPAGYDCASKMRSTITKCATGYFSKFGQSNCTKCLAGQSCPYLDAPFDECVPGTFMATDSQTASCTVCPEGSACGTKALSTSTTCKTTEFSFIGSTACTTCPTQGQCVIDRMNVTQDCWLGQYYDTATKKCVDCPSGFQCSLSAKTVCPFGTMYDQNYAKCVECTDVHICVYSSTGASLSPDRWCYGRDPAMSTIMDAFVNAIRLPASNYQYCIDCNHPSIVNQICTFSTNYFVSQTGANITCPAQRSAIQEVSIAGTKYKDQRFWDPYSQYKYPYCKADLDMYWPQFTGQILNYDLNCLPLVEYFDNRYVKSCQQAYPGFSTVKSNAYQTPTDQPLSSLYSIIEQREFGTKTLLKQCPDTQEFVTMGAGSQEQGCLFRKSGDCKDLKANFCHDGTDFKCLRGFTENSDSTITKRTKNKCNQPCPAGSVCSPDTSPTVKACSAGRYCFDGTEDPSMQVSRPGRNVQSTTSGAGVTTYSDIDCTQGMCPPSQADDTNYCPPGYRLDVTKNAHGLFNCHPNEAQKFTQTTMNGAGNSPTVVSTPCTDGYYCPEAVRSLDGMIPCEPGTYSNYNSASTLAGPQSKTQCLLCPGGMQCPSGTKTSTRTTNKGGFYSVNNTRHIQEYYCPSGTFSSEGNSARSQSECTQCPAGSYCKDGTATPVTCPNNAYCPAGNSIFTDCPMNYLNVNTGGQSVSDCQTCPANNMCPGGSISIACPAGTAGSWNPYNSVNDTGSMICKPIKAGSYSSAPASSSQTCPNGKYSSTYAQACVDCPEGSYCVSGVKQTCAPGKYCPSGSSSEQACPAGKICYLWSQDRQLFCPSGSYCTTSAGQSTTVTSTNANYFNVQGETTYTQNQCGNGYLCPGGSTGPYDQACPANTLSLLGETTCKKCTLGKWCPTGSGLELDCPLGFYCNGVDPYPTKCPKGTFGAAKNLQDATFCTQCPPGKTCSQNGLIAPDGDCDAGYYCKGGAWTPQPDDNDPLQAATGGLCLIGGYCPKGSGTTTSCNPGYFNSFPGMRTADDCILCTPGYYCAGSANPFPTGMCSAGSYCTGGSFTPTQYDATPGNYALQGSTMQIKCEAGTYSDTSKAAVCKPCDSGKYCPDIGMNAGIPCPAGYYCPLGSINEAPCLIGTYNPSVASAGANACLNCDAGKYCDQEGLTAVSGDCQPGFYCNKASPSQYPYVTFTAMLPSQWNIVTYPYGICPRGYYCPLSTSVPNACPIGYYLNTEGADSEDDCIRCNPGYYCNSVALTAPVGQCDQGFYCPDFSTSKQQVNCPPGSYCLAGSATPTNCPAGQYQDSANSISCKPCTAGYYCQTGSSAEVKCPAGYYCPANSELPTPCPTSIAGYYNPLEGQSSLSACILVPQNLYALVAGSNTADGIGFGSILDGFINTAGSRYPIPPAGTAKSSYCPRGYTCVAGLATACPAGKYCEDYKLTTPSGPCRQGYYCTLGSISATPSITGQGGRCPQSQFCVEGSQTGTKCPAGFYSNGIGLFDLTDCNTCPDGYVCDTLGTTDATIKQCPAGSYCPAGVSAIGTAFTCPIGSFCPLLSTQPQLCPPGKYQDQTGQSTCKTCPIGQYCPYGSSAGVAPGTGYIVDTVGMVGPAPCPPKTYKIFGQNTVCTDCPAGYFCDEYGLQGTPNLPDIKKCPGGFFCPAKTDDYSVNMCQPGYYCPVGSQTQTKCDVGKYCDDYQLSAPKGDCEAGYYCILGATKPNPDDGGLTGKQCDKGYFCLSGANSQTPCPVGKYNDKQGASSLSFCLNCPTNKVCNTLGLGDPVTQCDEGYYCTTDNGIFTKILCDPGYRCPANEQTKFRCLPGTYQSLSGQKSCSICSAGYYCYESDGLPISTPQECPKGYYCPDLSSQFTQNPNIVAVYAPLPCPIGTYSDVTKLTSVTQCKACPAGYRCNRKGQETYDYGTLDNNKCINGYECNIGTSNAQSLPECPLHHYCIAGVKTSCPPGTFGTTIGLASASECVQCSPGLMCLTPTNQVDCPSGFFCSGGVSSNIIITGCPVGQICPTECPVGNYCPSKSMTPLPCAMGFYQDETTKSQCKECPAGTYCQFNGTITPTVCIDGMFCAKASIYPRPCPIGTKPDINKATCIACPQGKYCWPEKIGGVASSERGDCAPGYICNSGSYTPKPFSDTSGITSSSAKFTTYNGPALRGFTSIDGKTNNPCPAGTYQPSLFGSVCIPCQAGSYCERSGTGQLREDSFPCPEGVICAAGTANVNDAQQCPQGLYSERGSPHCMRCSDGYYKDPSYTSCKTCPFGMYCNNSNSLQPQFCTDQTQCTGGDPYDPPCDSGMYLSPNTKKCIQCTAGQYCVGGIISGQCTAGYLCNAGSSTPTPDNLCPQNNYCLHGAGMAAPCKTGTFRSVKGGIQSTDCSTCEAGQICLRNQVPQDCPLGFYCPVEAGKALACPAGTYGDKTKLIVISDCKDCPAGYLCSRTNITAFKNYSCPLGSYCLARALVPTSCPAGTYRNITGGRYEQDCYDCPEGYYCPQKSIQPIKCTGATNCPEKSKYFKTCEGGYYCNDDNNQQQTLCPMNYYCPRGTQKPILCSARHICQEGSELPLLCQAGNIVRQAQYGMVNTCEMCPQGTYSTVQDEQCNPCTPGYLCYGQTSKKYPTLFRQHKGEICPKGHYCPLGSYLASPCPIGTYNPEIGASSITQCLLCPSDTFNDRTGQSGCRPCGAYASSTEGSYTCKCVGNFRTFSVADSSCRCMSGYDFIDSISRQSRGKESGTDNCSPLVFDRCDGLNQTRSASGLCVSVDDCSKACNGGNGTRSLTLGICTCFSKPNVDLVCGQSCRNSAPKLSIDNGTTMNYITTDPQTGKQTTTKLDLSKVGDLYGGLTCATGDNCDVKTTEMSSNGGFYGKYGAPSLVNSTVKKLRMLHSSDEDFNINGQQRILSLSDSDRYYFQEEEYRNLAVMQDPVDISQAALKNPVICLAKGDSMIFTIRNPYHYPVYLKDSVINSNPSFDYGSFLILSDQMKTKQANNITAPSMFAFTFTVQGSYVFVDASDQEQLMIVRVAGAGESCPDPDRYIQPLSTDSVSSSGVKQKEDIIIKPDVPLLVGMGSILVLSILTVMIGVGYCLHKGWSLPKVNLRGYRSLYLKTDVDHVSEETFRKNNDFSKFKSFLDMGNDSDKSKDENLVGDEDDLDDLNLNIHLDVLSAGQEYLKVFGDQKVLRAREKRERKSDVVSMITEIEQLINTIGSDALIHQMQLLNEEEDEEDSDDEDGENNGRKKKNLREQQEEQRRKQQEEQQKLEDERRQKMMQQEWSERDRQLLDQAKTDANETLSKLKKELNRNVLENISGSNSKDNQDESMQVGLYDQNAKSRQNQIVRQIESDPNLSAAEKEALLRAHNQNLTNIDEMMDAEKRKQDNELEKAIRDRAERRRKALENKYKKEINAELKEGELVIKEDIEARKVEGSKVIDREIDKRLEEAATTGDKGSYRRSVDDLKKERAERKGELEDTLNKEQESRIMTLREQVMEKWTKEAMNTDQDLEAILTGQQPSLDDALSQLRSQKEIEEAKLRERLEQRRKRLKEDLNNEKDKFEEDLNNKDPLVEEELEKKKQLAMMQHQSIIDNQGSKANLNVGGITPPQSSLQQQQDSAQQNFLKVLSQVDTNLSHSALIDALREQGADEDLIERLRLEQEEEQKRKLDSRRDLLRQRKALKKQQELEMKKLEEQLNIMQEEDDEKSKIGKNYLKEMFVQAENIHNSKANLVKDDATDKARQQERLVVFNEYASDELLKRLSNLLMKQFVERESALKLLVQKYMDARLIEKTHIKAHYKDENARLTSLAQQNLLSPEQLRDAQCQLRLREENLLREVDIQFERAHKEEEVRLRSDMDARHANEQIELRRQEIDEQARIRKELELSGQGQRDEEIDRINLKAFEEAKKREQERKQRSLHLHKQEAMRQLEGELRNKYTDYEELLRRKREEEALLADQNLSISKRIAERRQKIKESASMFSAEELKSMMEKHELYLQTFDSEYENERRRQQMQMMKRMQQRKMKLEKQNAMKAKADVQDIDKIKSRIGNGELMDDMDERLLKIDEREDTELVRRLREWTRSRQELKVSLEQRQLAETVIDLDAMTLKKLISKLDNLEKGLKELRKMELIKAKMPNRPGYNNNNDPNNQGGLNQGGLNNNNPSGNKKQNQQQRATPSQLGLIQSPQEIHYKDQMSKFVSTPGVHGSHQPVNVNNPFSKQQQQQDHQSPMAQKVGSGLKANIMSPKNVAGDQKRSPGDKLKQVEEETKHGMKKEDYTKFSKFAKKR